jgi:histidyl-tRNA synthetase
MTPTFARMVAARANALRKPVRWFSIPQLFRYERQQKGRLREHFQLNVDIVGESEVSADAELLAVAIEIMRGCGLTPDDVVARVSDRRLLNALLRAWGVPDELVPATYAAIDKIERDPQAVLLDRLQAAGLAPGIAERVLHGAAASDRAALRAEHAGDHDVVEALARVDRYFELAAAHGLAEWVQFDLAIVRGLAYYTGIVFELFDRKGEFRAICGGGRYDALLKDLGGVDLPALGFGMGDVVLGELLRARGRMPASVASPDFWVAFTEPAQFPRAVAAASRLRRGGASVEYSLKEQALARQLKTAATVGAPRVIIVGSSSEPANAIMVKSMVDGSQQSTTLDAILETFERVGRAASDLP